MGWFVGDKVGVSMLKKLVMRLAKHNKKLEIAGKILEHIDRSRGGGSMSKVLAGFAIAGEVLDVFNLGEDPFHVLSSRGYTYLDCPVGGFLCEQLLKLPATVIIPLGLSATIRLWEGPEGGAAAVFSNRGEFLDGPYISGGQDFLMSRVQEIVWGSNGSDLLLSVPSEGWFYKGSQKFGLSKLSMPGPYIGFPGPEHYAERLSKFGVMSRSLLFRGPSGTGKSVLARRVSQLSHDGAHTLKINGISLDRSNPSELESMIRFLKPAVLLIDDISFGNNRVEALLLAMETLRVDGCCVIATMMTSNDGMKPGGSYIDGMRPGRFDEIYNIDLPDKVRRKEILDYYADDFGVKLPRGIVGKCSGLSGAYLREVVLRLKAYGLKSWKEEVSSILYMAPVGVKGSSNIKLEEGCPKSLK